MRCFSCYNLSTKPICKECRQDLLTLDINKERVGNLEVISFFDYYLVMDFIKSKYSSSGYRLYKFFAKEYFNPFIKNFIKNLENREDNIYLIGIDENIKKGYSAISVLLHNALKGVDSVKPLYNVLKAQNRVRYAGRSLEYRLNNPRDFIYSGPKNIDVILIDDTITTGITLEEAHRVLKSNGVNVLFALTVAVAKEEMDY